MVQAAGILPSLETSWGLEVLEDRAALGREGREGRAELLEERADQEAWVLSWSGRRVQEEEELEGRAVLAREDRVDRVEAVEADREGREGREVWRPKEAGARELPSFSLQRPVLHLEAVEAGAGPVQRVVEAEAGLLLQQAEAEAGLLDASRQDLDLWEEEVREARAVRLNQAEAEAVEVRRPAWAEAQEPLQMWAAQKEAARERPQAARAEASPDLPPSAEAEAARRQTTESPVLEEADLHQRAGARAEDSEVHPFHPSHPLAEAAQAASAHPAAPSCWAHRRDGRGREMACAGCNCAVAHTASSIH